MNRKMNSKWITLNGMFAALSFAAVLVGRLVPNVAGFLSYDPKDAVVAIAGFLLGPWSAVFLSLVVSLVEMYTISTTGIYGMLMNFISTAAFALPAAMIYRKKKSFQGALIGLGIGVLFMTGCMVLWNYLITPLYMGVPREQVAEMLVPIFLPFNFIKGGLNAGLTLLLYKPLVTALRRLRLVPSKAEGSHQAVRAVLFWVGAAAFCVFLLLFLIFVGAL